MIHTGVLVGHCAVDSGQIMIADPSYVVGDYFTQEDYEAVCQITLSGEQNGELPFANGIDGRAVASSTGVGDGFYPVYATYMDLGDFGRRVASLTIDFSDHLLLGDD